MSLLKTFANALRIKAGAKPLIITTSTAMGNFVIDSPLLSLLTKKDTSAKERLPAHFKAIAKEGFRRPEQQTWQINLVVNNGQFEENIIPATSYEHMLDFMLQKELSATRSNGHQGSDKEIIKTFRPVVTSKNILHFI